MHILNSPETLKPVLDSSGPVLDMARPASDPVPLTLVLIAAANTPPVGRSWVNTPYLHSLFVRKNPQTMTSSRPPTTTAPYTGATTRELVGMGGYSVFPEGRFGAARSLDGVSVDRYRTSGLQVCFGIVFFGMEN